MPLKWRKTGLWNWITRNVLAADSAPLPALPRPLRSLIKWGKLIPHFYS